LSHAGLRVGASRTIDPPGSGADRLTVCLWVGVAEGRQAGDAGSDAFVVLADSNELHEGGELR
jgi:hypothetical protein